MSEGVMGNDDYRGDDEKVPRLDWSDCCATLNCVIMMSESYGMKIIYQ